MDGCRVTIRYKDNDAIDIYEYVGSMTLMTTSRRIFWKRLSERPLRLYLQQEPHDAFPKTILLLLLEKYVSTVWKD